MFHPKSEKAYKNIPGEYRIELINLEDSGTKPFGNPGKSVQEIIDIYKGEKFTITDPRGKIHKISLEKWTAQDQSKVKLTFRVVFAPSRRLTDEEVKAIRSILG